MNTKRLFSIFLLIFVFSSIVFWVQKEFLERSREKVSSSVEDSQEVNIITKNQEADISTQTTTQGIKSKVVAYYFHGTYRCPTCLTIERYSKEAIEQYFTKELQEGRLEFKPLNVEEPENRHYIQDYQLYTKSLVITLHKDNKQTEWKNLENVWTNVRDKEKFYQYVKEEIEKFLEEAE